MNYEYWLLLLSIIFAISIVTCFILIIFVCILSIRYKYLNHNCELFFDYILKIESSVRESNILVDKIVARDAILTGKSYERKDRMDEIRKSMPSNIGKGIIVPDGVNFSDLSYDERQKILFDQNNNIRNN